MCIESCWHGFKLIQKVHQRGVVLLMMVVLNVQLSVHHLFFRMSTFFIQIHWFNNPSYHAQLKSNQSLNPPPVQQNLPHMNHFPLFLHQFIEDVVSVGDDGHCWFRVVMTYLDGLLTLILLYVLILHWS